MPSNAKWTSHQKVTLYVAIIGVAVSAGTFIIDRLSSRSNMSNDPAVTQITSGFGSPAIANTKGNVTVTGTLR